MPQAVETYIKTKSFKEVDLIKRDILNLYKDDIVKYSGDDSIKVQSIFEEIPSQLQKHEKRFSFNSMQKDARYRDYKDAFFVWQMTYTGRRFITTDESHATDPYSVHNLLLGYRYSFRNGTSLTPQMRIDNLFDPYYESTQYYPKPLRNCLFSLLFEF